MTVIIYSDDTDAAITFEVTRDDGGDIDWTPLVAVAGGEYESATWLDPVGNPRRIQYAMPLGLGLPDGAYRVHMKVPSGNDVQLGWVAIQSRG